VVAGACAIGLLVSYFIIGADSSSHIKQVVERNAKPELPTDSVNLQELWQSRIESNNQIMEERFTYLEKLVLEGNQREDKALAENNDLRQQIARLKDELRQISSSQESAYLGSPPLGLDLPVEDFTLPDDDLLIQAPLREYVMPAPLSALGNVEEAIPAGTSVKALLVGSVDAPCGVYSATDPQPVKLRILDDGHLPGAVRARLRGGIVIASAYGDISTERVYMRLERLTQVKPNGDFMETVVTGYVSGEDGRYGVRGNVVDRSGHLIGSAAFSGFFSGVSTFLQATVNAQNVRDATCGLPNDIRWDLVKEGCTSGASNALDMLSDYYIRRAEQIQPVLQVNAGRVVDITFTHGADLGDLHTHQRVKETREMSRREDLT
jgi:conjugal transfer pilus assembly protein TraB